MSLKLPGLHTVLPAKGSPLLSVRVIEAPRPIIAPTTARRRLWELHNTFHCSVIGTCLTTGELRQVLSKLGDPGIDKETDHQLHGRAVLLAAKRDLGSKLLQKALDRRHRTAIAHFGKAQTSAQLLEIWNAAVRDGDIPGAFWAVVTHPETTDDLIKKVFGEVHMLSHLVGAANRADIRKLHAQEQQIAALNDKVCRQQALLKDASLDRQRLGRELQAAQAALSSRRTETAQCPSEDAEQLASRLAAERGKVTRLEQKIDALAGQLAEEHRVREHIEARMAEMSTELEAAEAAWSKAFPAAETGDDASPVDLNGMTLLYVGGKPGHVAQMRSIAQLWNAILLSHDGGLEERAGRLESYIARAERILFPVDFVSHNAVAAIKRGAQITGKPFIPLRSASLSAFVVALDRIARTRVTQGSQAPALT